MFTGTADAAQRAVGSRISSPGHFKTTTGLRCGRIGADVTQYGGITRRPMSVGIPGGVGFYA